jgi:hypothetical protein
MNRHDQILERLKQAVLEEGYADNTITYSSEHGYGDFKSYVNLLIDLKLEGKNAPTVQEVWENMKMQILFRERALVDASDDYLMLHNKYRDLQNNYNELLKEITPQLK